MTGHLLSLAIGKVVPLRACTRGKVIGRVIVVVVVIVVVHKKSPNLDHEI